MKANHKKLLNSVINAIDWESILRVHKSFNYGIGTGQFSIPGLKRKETSINLTIQELKHELNSIIKYIINNDISSLQYGHWHIFWTNEDWEYLYYDDEDEYVDMDDENARNDLPEMPDVKARLEVLYCPQRIMLIDSTKLIENSSLEKSKIIQLKKDLENAIELEDYERAEKIRKSIESLKKSDK